MRNKEKQLRKSSNGRDEKKIKENKRFIYNDLYAVTREISSSALV